MADKQTVKTARTFGAKEKVLNYACQTYQLSRPNKVGPVMALIRECQPASLEEWTTWYFDHANTKSKHPQKIDRDHLKTLGQRLYERISTVVIPEWVQAFNDLSEQDCIDYIFNLTLNRTYDGFVREKSVISLHLQRYFPNVRFEPSPEELDHTGNIDFLGWVSDRAFGLQIKPVTAQSNFGNYSIDDRMKKAFKAFTQQYGGSVFTVFSEKEMITNPVVVQDIEKEINRLSHPLH